MGLVKEYLNSIEGVEIYAIISMIIFFLFFIIVILYSVMLRKNDVKEYSELPFDDENHSVNNNQ
jgi:preprotein translocase subunit SecG